LKRPTAIKLLSPERNAPEDLDRFRREVQMTAKLKHPNTVTIYDYGRTDDGTFYYAMELLDGVTLLEIVQASGPAPESRVVHILSQCAMALQEAHSIGLVHRDIKPNNIMMTQQGGVHDVTKVLDFGLVKSIDSRSDATNTVSEAIIGTPRFMSPEQILDPPSVDARSDLYALGAVGYYLLTGGFVFEGENPIEICAQHLSSEPEVPSFRLGHEIKPDLEILIMQCLEKKRDDRPASAVEIAERLQTISVKPWSQGDAAQWWSTVGREIIATRERHIEVGSLATIQAGHQGTESES
jgi:serine/threonine protein kinase